MALFESMSVLWGRAQDHLEEFREWEMRLIDKYRKAAFFASDPETGDILLKCPPIKNPPLAGSGIVFDCVNCLRSSLDHAVFDASILLGGDPKPRNTKFPFGGTAEQAAANLDNEEAEVPEILRPHLLAFKPYKGGNDLLWGLNKLRNSKIHQTLEAMITAPAANLEGSIKHMVVLNGPEPSLDDDLTLMRIQAGAEMEGAKPSVVAEIVFSEESPFPGQEAEKVLGEMVDEVLKVLKDIQAKAEELAQESTPQS
jgi:hypothetical protein